VDAAFVHAATGAHAALVRPLLEAGVPTYVDKPLDYHLSGARELVDVAERSRCSLMVGFNRRYAPDYVELRALPRTVVLMHKHRHDLPEEVRTAVFDDFIHVVDTLRFLVDGTVTATDVRVRTVAGRVHQIVLHLSTVGQTAVGVMHRAGGGAEERVEVVGDGVQRVVHDLAEVVEQRDGRETRRRRGDWTPVAEQRGIAGACEHFLAAVRSGRVLSARDALGTHEVCEQVVEAAGSGPPAAG
jgi:virulence factor